MAPRADLTGQVVDDWSVNVKAPAQNRVPFWTCTHEPCGTTSDLPHVVLTKAIAGKGSLPACTTCVSASDRPRIDHGMHLACGQAHLIGTPCPASDDCSIVEGKHVISDPASGMAGDSPWDQFEVPAEERSCEPIYACIERDECYAGSVGVQGCPGLPGEALMREAEAISDDLLQAITPAEEPAAFTVDLPQGFREHFDLAAVYTGHPAQNLPESAFQQATKAAALAMTANEARAEAEPPVFDAEANARINERADWMPLQHMQAAWAEHRVEREQIALYGRVDRLDAPQDTLDVIRRAMAGQQRNHQSEPGPSQFGGCERRLGYHLATGQGNGGTDDSAWRPQVGTAVHAWLDEAFSADNKTSDRWLTSYRVTNPVPGTIDIADTHRRTAVDFKITGKTTRDKAARGVISDKYEVQLDLYALGLINDGYAIETVALLMLPASGSLSESVWYERPVDLDRAREAVNRRDRIKAMLSVAEVDKVLAVLSTSDDYCASCPALGKFCKGFEGANLWGAPEPVWPAYEAAIKAAG